MWRAVCDAINDAQNTDFHIEERQQIGEGYINLAFHISSNTQHYFVKVNEKHCLGTFEAEAVSLNLMHEHSPIRTPRVITTGQTLNNAFIVLEYLKLEDTCETAWATLGHQLAQLHQNPVQKMFGFDDDNTIGSSPQPNQWCKKWACFFAEQRIGWMLQLLEEQGVHFIDIDRAVNATREILAHHHPTPSLVHGDLWRGNVSFMNDEPVIYDPACYYGDREVDLAMSELFGAFPSEFYASYNEIYPINDGYQTRKHLYNLYHILNHAYMFKGYYLTQARALINQLLR